MGVSLGLVGLGAFGSAFAPLFKRHPLVSRIALCDSEPDRVKQFAQREDFADKFNPRDAYSTLDEICRAKLDALVIITQPWLHAPQCIQAMEHGKHVYSAVPVIMLPDDGEILDWCDRLVTTSRTTGRHYMLGETTWYHPQAMFCRRKFGEGGFGDVVYCEGEYMHDVDAACNLREVYRRRTESHAGRGWIETLADYARRGARGGPMHYPTHSTSGPVSVTGARAEKVTAYGFANRTDDPFFEHDAFSNETALFSMSDGSTFRVCEFREVAGAIADHETFRIVGTRGTFAENVWKENFRTAPDNARPLEETTLTDEQMRDPLPDDVVRAFWGDHGDSGAYGGHNGSHPYLVHEFVSSVAEGRPPAIDVTVSAHLMAMGVTAHKSALAEGERLDVPRWD